MKELEDHQLEGEGGERAGPLLSESSRKEELSKTRPGGLAGGLAEALPGGLADQGRPAPLRVHQEGGEGWLELSRSECMKSRPDQGARQHAAITQ